MGSISTMIETGLQLGIETLKLLNGRMRVANYEKDLKDDEYIKQENELAAADPSTAPAHIANAQLRQQQKIGRHELQRISPL